MPIDQDTCEWLGCPTPLEMYKHQCALLEDELTQALAMLKKARANIAGLVQLSDELSTGKASAEAEGEYQSTLKEASPMRCTARRPTHERHH